MRISPNSGLNGEEKEPRNAYVKRAGGFFRLFSSSMAVAIPWSTRLLNEIPEKLEKRALSAN